MKRQQQYITALADCLFVLIADLLVTSVKTLRCHWNMRDPRFYFLHKLLDEQYHELHEMIDMVAEQIRQRGPMVPATLQEFSRRARSKEMTHDLSGDGMIETLAYSYDELSGWIVADIQYADVHGDIATSDMLTEVLRKIQKTAWVLRSHILHPKI